MRTCHLEHSRRNWKTEITTSVLFQLDAALRKNRLLPSATLLADHAVASLALMFFDEHSVELFVANLTRLLSLIHLLI